MRTQRFSAPARVLAFALLLFVGGAAQGQQLYKCGANYQDRPCATQDVQQRYSSATGFSVEAVNHDTDKDCARGVSEVFVYWTRMNAGESHETLKAEFDAKPIAKAEKSLMRDMLLVLREYRGTPKEVRSQLETQCMAYKRSRGMPTEKQLAAGAALESSRSSVSDARNRAAQMRAEQSYIRAEQARIRMEEARARQAAEAAARAAAAGR